jgi:hypothetical protein
MLVKYCLIISLLLSIVNIQALEIEQQEKNIHIVSPAAHLIGQQQQQQTQEAKLVPYLPHNKKYVTSPISYSSAPETIDNSNNNNNNNNNVGESMRFSEVRSQTQAQTQAQSTTQQQQIFPYNHMGQAPLPGFQWGQQLPSNSPWPGVVTAAAPLQRTTTSPITYPFSRRPFARLAVQVMPGARIIGEDACGCPPGQNPCLRPCQHRRTVTDDIRDRINTYNTRIVHEAQKLQQHNIWIKQVRHIIRHYDAKIKSVEDKSNQIKQHIRALFAKKQHYAELLKQRLIDKETTGHDTTSLHSDELEHEILDIKQAALRHWRPHSFVFRND